MIPSPNPARTPFTTAMLPPAADIVRARRKIQLNALFITALGLAGYVGLVLAPVGWPVRALSAVVLTAAAVATATSIMHDANHGAFSRSRRLNRIAGYSSDLLGASSWIWRYKHNVLHHASPNVVGMDTDIEEGPFARLAPGQRWYWFHRYQHLYLWFLYGFLAIQWLLVADFADLIRNKVGDHPLPQRPRRRDVALIVAGKLFHVGWAVAIPLLLHSWWTVLVVYAVCSWVVGFSLAVIFQLAHCVTEAEFFTPEVSRRGVDFARHQLATTVDFRCTVPVVGPILHWLVGGLDHQVEHHLAAGLPHTLYPTLAPRVQALCHERGLTYRVQPTVSGALRSHSRWLKEMGKPPIATPAEQTRQAA